MSDSLVMVSDYT